MLINNVAIITNFANVENYKKIAEVARNKNAEVIVICFYLVLAHIYGVLELSASIT